MCVPFSENGREDIIFFVVKQSPVKKFCSLDTAKNAGSNASKKAEWRKQKIANQRHLVSYLCADGETRTRTGKLPLPPQSSASTISPHPLSFPKGAAKVDIFSTSAKIICRNCKIGLLRALNGTFYIKSVRTIAATASTITGVLSAKHASCRPGTLRSTS